MKTTQHMARESWIDVYGLGKDRAQFLDALKHFEALVRDDEREACALLCEHMGIDGYGTLAIAAAIRARGNK